MEKQIIHFNNFELIKKNKHCNIPKISKIEKQKLVHSFKEKGWHNGKLLTADTYDFKDDKIICGKSNFYDFLICHEIKQNISPVISLNAIIYAEDSLILIKRPKNVSSYPGWWDFPAGMVYFEDSLEDRLFERIYSDTQIKKEHLKIKERIVPSITLDGMALNFFYLLDYQNKKQNLETHFYNRFSEDKPLILPKNKVRAFIETNPVVFSEILDKNILEF